MDKEWEVGTIAHENFRRFGPALLFEKIDNFRTPLLLGGFGTRKRYAMALGVEPASKAIFSRWGKAFKCPLKPRVVVSASCQETAQESYPGHVRDIMSNVWGLPGTLCKHVVVVDEDIESFNPFEVEWAIATRIQASRDVQIVKNGKSFPLDPSQVPSRRGWSDLLGIDATAPTEWYALENASFPASSDPPPECLERGRANRAAYRFAQ